MNAKNTSMGIHTFQIDRAGRRRKEGRVRNEVSYKQSYKFFNTNLARAKVNRAVKEILMGHSIQLDGNYYRLSHDEMLQEYLKAVDLLAINEENNLRRQPESKKAK